MSSPVVEDRLNALERELAEVKVELARVGMTVPVTSSLGEITSLDWRSIPSTGKES